MIIIPDITDITITDNITMDGMAHIIIVADMDVVGKIKQPRIFGADILNAGGLLTQSAVVGAVAVAASFAVVHERIRPYQQHAKRVARTICY